MKNEIVLFTDGDVNIEVQINPEQETVWLTQKQMEVLFDVKHATVFLLQENWMRLLSVFPTEVQGDENPKFIIWI